MVCSCSKKGENDWMFWLDTHYTYILYSWFTEQLETTPPTQTDTTHPEGSLCAQHRLHTTWRQVQDREWWQQTVETANTPSWGKQYMMWWFIPSCVSVSHKLSYHTLHPSNNRSSLYYWAPFLALSWTTACYWSVAQNSFTQLLYTFP